MRCVKHEEQCLAWGDSNGGLFLCAHGTPRAMIGEVVSGSELTVGSWRVRIRPYSFSPQHQVLRMEMC